jgi:mitochondrial-processing peptidase subunit alpha
VLQIVSQMESMGAVCSAHSSREQMLFCVDVLRDHLEPATELLADSVMNPLMSNEEVEMQKNIVNLQMEDMMPDTLMKEALQAAAYVGQPLGKPHMCSPER